MTVAGQVFALAPGDKLPGAYLQTAFGVRSDAALPNRALLLIGAKALSGGTLTADTEYKEVIADGDEVTLTGNEGNELARMTRMARRVWSGRLFLATVTQDTNAAATATLTIAGSWTTASSGPVQIFVGGQQLDVFSSAADTATTFAAAIVAAVTLKKELPVTAANSAGVVTFTWKSYGTRGNDGILYVDGTFKAAGMTLAVAGGASVASGGVRFTGGTGTEDLTTLLTNIAVEQFWTTSCAIIDATNLARLEAYLDTKCGPLVRLFENHVVGTTKAYAAATSLAQTTLDNARMQMVWQEEGETPGEEQGAWMAALRSNREVSNPNVNYDGIATPFVPQRATSKRMSRTTQVAALDVGPTCKTTKNNVAYVARAITTRSLTSTGAADDGTIDVGQARTPDVINEEIGGLWTAYTNPEDTTAHHYLVNNPSPGNEADVPAGTTYPADWQQQVTLYMKSREATPYGWVTEVDSHPTVVNMNPTSSTPRFVQYTPVIVTPLAHQLEGTIAQTKFVPQ